MKSLALGGLVAIGVGLAAAAPAPAGSIYAKASTSCYTPRFYADDVARRVGDVLTIIVDERSDVDNQTERKNTKTQDTAAAFSGSVALNDMTQWWGKAGAGAKPFKLPTVNATNTYSNGLDGKADLKAQRNLTDHITVTVHDVLPNGNLVVLGSRTRNVYGDAQVICISGVVRQSDITFANTINSDQVADFQMISVMKGPENDTTDPNWLSKLLNHLMPW
jgi:flagellar L-ring protein precursor FlgH